MMQILSFCASLLAAAQAVYGLISGETVCLNEGCRLVERLTAVSPVTFNILGFLYFQSVFWSLRLWKQRTVLGVDPTGLLLLAGLAVEGVLVSYQLFVARVVCNYCIFIALCVIFLNLLHGRKQIISGGAVAAAIFISFSLLSFLPGQTVPQYYWIENGSYGVKTCTSPSKDIFLIFSAACGHCKKVIDALDECNSCNFFLNPVEILENFSVNGLELKASYTPEINRLLLSILGIREVPVLVVRDTAGFSFIRGADRILSYVRRACFDSQPVLYFDRSRVSTHEQMSVMTDDDGTCSIHVECPEDEKGLLLESE